MDKANSPERIPPKFRTKPRGKDQKRLGGGARTTASLLLALNLAFLRAESSDHSKADMSSKAAATTPTPTTTTLTTTHHRNFRRRDSAEIADCGPRHSVNLEIHCNAGSGVLFFLTTRVAFHVPSFSMSISYDACALQSLQRFPYSNYSTLSLICLINWIRFLHETRLRRLFLQR